MDKSLEIVYNGMNVCGLCGYGDGVRLAFGRQ